MYKGMKKEKKIEKGISLIALIITIIVIIIISGIVISTAMNTPETANKAKFLGDLSEIQQAVAIKRAENLIPTINNIDADMNTGFTKVMIKKEPGGEFVDGWVVNLETIKVKKSTLGNEYSTVASDSQIIFGASAPDVFVYDSNGEVFYAEGFKDGDNTIYSLGFVKGSGIVEPANPEYWSFNELTGIISEYKGPSVDTLVVPNYIKGKKVNEIKTTTQYEGITFSKSIQNIIVSEGITELSNYAFGMGFSIKNITLPSSIKTIGYMAFYSCSDLTNINIPDGVTRIEDYAFYGCEKLANIILPNTLEYIGSNSFASCIGLTSIIIPNSVVDAGSGSMFKGCTNLTSAVLSSNLTFVPSNMFEGCTKLSNVTIPEGVAEIRSCVFKNCTSLTGITIPNTVTRIYYGNVFGQPTDSFIGCTNITQITVYTSETLLPGAPWGATNANVTWST